MGCIGSSNRNLQQPTYSAILQDIFELVPREESLQQFNKKSEIMKYYNEFDWITIQPQFKQHVRTLIDHIESYKIRLTDSVLYVENKIKLSQNPIVIKMCMLILLEIVQNMQKFILQKEIPIFNNDESKLDASQRSIQIEHLQSLTQVSDNFLKFELSFSNILSQLINEKLIYATVWWEYLLQTLELFSKKSSKQFQSENIQSILSFLEYIIGMKLSYSDCFEFVLKTNEQHSAMQDLLDSIKDLYGIIVVYKDTLQMTPIERLFATKNQKQLFNILLKDHKKFDQPAWHKLTETFLSRILSQQMYEDLFIILFSNFDEEIWRQPKDIIDITLIVLSVAKQINQLQNTEIAILTKLIDYLDQQNDRPFYESPNGLQQLIRKSSEQKSFHVSNSVKNSVVKLLSELFTQLESSQFLIFQQHQTTKALLQNIKQNPDPENINDTKQCLFSLLKQISLDMNSVQFFVQQILFFAYGYSQNLSTNTAINQNILINLIQILDETIDQIDINNQNIIITEELVLLTIEIADTSIFVQIQCVQFLTKMFNQAGKIHSNNNFEVISQHIPNSNIIGLATYYIINVILSNQESKKNLEILINLFIEYIQFKLNKQQIFSLVNYLMEDNQNKSNSNKVSKSIRRSNFDQLKDKEIRLLMIIHLLSQLDEETANQFNLLLYNIIGSQFQQIKKKGFDAFQDIELILEKKEINEQSQQIQSLCLKEQLLDFDKIRKQFKENLDNQQNQNGLINLEDIQVKDDHERGSFLNQSFQAPSFVEVQLDESFEKQLQAIKKQKIKQEKLEHLATEQREINEY